MQVFIESSAGLKGDELERELFIVRKRMEKEKAAALGEDHWDFYACTLSNRTIVYKGMLNSAAGARSGGRLGAGGRACMHRCTLLACFPMLRPAVAAACMRIPFRFGGGPARLAGG